MKTLIFLTLISLHLPPTQKKFMEISDHYALRYEKTSNEINRMERADAMQQLFQPILQAIDWHGKIRRIWTTPDGRVHLSIELPGSRAVVETWYNPVVDTAYNTLIPKRSKIYDVLRDMGDGDDVVFSCAFYPSSEDYLYETSFTTYGSMMEPEYLCRFTALRAATGEGK